MLKEKIDEIMRLAGVASRDFEAARRNYERLDETEIDRRLAGLRKGSAWIKEWRSQQGWVLPIADANQISAEVLSAVEASLERVDRIDKSLESIALAFSNKIRQRSFLAALTEQIRDTEKRLAQYVITHFSKDNSDRAFAFVKRRVEAIASLNELAAYEALVELGSILKHPVIPGNIQSLSFTGTIDALARVENSIAEKPPDLIVALNEGSTIAQIVMHHLKLNCPVVNVYGSADLQIKWEADPPGLVIPKTVWVIGHVSRTGGTLAQVILQARERYQTKDVRGAVLAASIDAFAHLSLFSFHQLAEGPTLSLAFDVKKKIEVIPDGYLVQTSGTNLLLPTTHTSISSEFI